MKKKYRIRKFSPLWWGRTLVVPACVLAIILAMALAGGEAAAEEEPVVTAEETVEIEPEEYPPQPESLGIFTITHYCRENYPHICNDGDSTYTATGTHPTPGRTIAADPSVIPYGTKVLIDGHEYIVEDCGGAIKQNRIDILVDTHAEAEQLGIIEAEVFEVTE